MSNVVSVPDAAAALGLDPSRVRALAAAGAIPAQKIGGIWLLDADDVERRRGQRVPAGRPLAPRNAWRVLLSASGGGHDPRANAADRWRSREALKRYGLDGLRPRLANHAEVSAYWALAGELRALHERNDVVWGGLSAAGGHDLGLLSDDRVDAYLPASLLPSIVSDHALALVRRRDANVILRAVPDDAWLLDAPGLAPAAAVALNLADDADPRLARVGHELIAKLDRGARSA